MFTVLKRSGLKLAIISAFFMFSTTNLLASDYEQETLMEVLENANLRAAPSTNAEILAVIPGGFVVAVSDALDSSLKWYRIPGSDGDYPAGYVYADLLASPTTSYETNEFSNQYHLVKEFRPTDTTYKTAVWPQSHARLYSLEGQFLTHLPRVKDAKELAGVYISPQELNSDLPFYELISYTGGAHCCFRSRFISKSNLFKSTFDINERISEKRYMADQDSSQIDVHDETYAYWQYSYAYSPIPLVTLEVDDEGMRVSKTAMIKNPPSVDEVKNVIKSTPPVDLDGIGHVTKVMLGYIYSGNFSTAETYLDAVWPKSFKYEAYDSSKWGKEEYKDELIKKIKSSPFFETWMLE
jgi:hypothetical protein